MFLMLGIIVVWISYNFALQENQNFRKQYGLSLNDGCSQYEKVFKCMTICKSRGQVYRLNYRCKCTCHRKPISSQQLPYFKPQTIGTTRKLPKTQSPPLYAIVGTLSPRPKKTTPKPVTTTTQLKTTPKPVITTAQLKTTSKPVITAQAEPATNQEPTQIINKETATTPPDGTTLTASTG